MASYTKTLFSDGSTVSYDNTRASEAVDMSHYSAFSIIAAWTTEAARTDKTFDSQKKALKKIGDVTYTAVAAGAAGNNITVEYLDSVKASKAIQDLTFTADAKGTGGNSITVAYTDTGFGSQVSWITPSAASSDISVIMQDSTDYAEKTCNGGQVASGTVQGIVWTGKVRGAYVSMVYTGGGFGGQETAARTGAGTSGDPYVVTATIQASSDDAVKTCAGGQIGSLVIQDLTLAADADERGTYMSVVYTDDGSGGHEAVTRTGAGTVGDPYVFDVEMQSGAAYSAKTFGSGAVNVSDNSITISANGFRDFIRVQFSGADLPDGISASTDYWVFEVDNDTFKVASSRADAGTGTAVDIIDAGTGTHTVTPFGSKATEIETALNAESDFTDVANVTVSGTGTDVQDAQVVTAFTGNVASAIDTTGDTITIVGHGFVNGTRVKITSTGTIPAGLPNNTNCWVVEKTDDTFKIEATYSGGAVTITDQGAAGATITVTPSPTTVDELIDAVQADGDSVAVVDSVTTGSTAMDAQTSTPLTGQVASAINVTDNTFTISGHGYLDGVRLWISSTGTLPAIQGGGNLTISTPYWVRDKTADTFKLAASYGGAAIDLADSVSGQGDPAATMTLTPKPPTATEIKTAMELVGDITTLVDITVSGTGTNVQTLQTSTALTGGLGGAAGSESVVVASSAIKVYLETGVSTAAQVETAVDNSTPAAALVTTAVDGGDAGNAQSVTAATNLAAGADAEVNTTTNIITSPTHGLVTGVLGRLTTTGTLPAPLAVSTDYYIIKVTDNTIKLATSYDNAIAGTEINITDTGSDEGVHTFDTTALSGSLVLQVTHDDPNSSSASWTTFSTTAISGNSSTILYSAGTGVPVIFPFRAFRLQSNVAGGGIAVNATAHIKNIMRS